MTTYVTLFEHTRDGKTSIERLPAIYEEAEEQFRAMGVEDVTVYYGSVGPYDGLAIMEAPDGRAVETIRLAFEREGTHEFETYQVFEAQEYFEMIEAGTS
jgi:uncharacterized protein with GYD domain